ncbi:hypothetical protein [Streptomyces fradiae]|uniref:hypothetical protein n=1 Tax=Streptomyces fradiae TaxID=1906 RepID=UPI0036697C0E
MLEFGGCKPFERVRLTAFERLERALDRRLATTRPSATGSRADGRAHSHWPDFEVDLADIPEVRGTIGT